MLKIFQVFWFQFASSKINNLYSSNKLIFISILFIIVTFISSGCSANDVMTCDDHKFTMHMEKPDEELTTGLQEFYVDYQLCQDFYNRTTWLEVSGPEHNYQDYYSGVYQLPSDGSSVSHTYTFVFSEPGLYYVNVGLGNINNGVYNRERATEIYSIDIVGEVQRELKIHELSMVGLYLWPSYSNYNGLQRRDWAYAEGNTIITSLTTLPDRTTVPIFDLEEDAQDWVYQNLGNTWPYYEQPIMCAIENFNVSFAPAGKQGFTRLKNIGENIPAICYVLNTRLRNYFGSQTLNLTIATASIAMHELGHARFNSLYHSGDGGDQAGVCLMLEELNINNLTNPHFCTNHENLLKEYSFKIMKAMK